MIREALHHLLTSCQLLVCHHEMTSITVIQISVMSCHKFYWLGTRYQRIAPILVIQNIRLTKNCVINPCQNEF